MIRISTLKHEDILIETKKIGKYIIYVYLCTQIEAFEI